MNYCFCYNEKLNSSYTGQVNSYEEQVNSYDEKKKKPKEQLGFF